MKKVNILPLGIIFLSISLVAGWYNSNQFDVFLAKSQAMKLSNNTRYCFHFTWMGGNFNNRTFKNIANKTCNQYFKDKRTLCINPMVATYTGGEPDLKYILDHHATAATCRVSQEQICAKYTVFHNGIVSYETRYCTQININLEGPMRGGCVQEKRESEVIEVCACTSDPGPDGICNSAQRFSAFQALATILVCLLLPNLSKLFKKSGRTKM